MEKLHIDLGVREFELNGGLLRFNPSDPNLYHRFMEALPAIQAVEDKLVADAKQLPQQDSGAAVLGLLAEADKQTKALLAEVFAGNDFDQLLEGVNLMAVAGNGERVITNLLAALHPIIEHGVQKFYDDKANAAVAAARANRQQRRADKRRRK